jgi:hypothetical protein
MNKKLQKAGASLVLSCRGIKKTAGNWRFSWYLTAGNEKKLPKTGDSVGT